MAFRFIFHVSIKQVNSLSEGVRVAKKAMINAGMSLRLQQGMKISC